MSVAAQPQVLPRSRSRLWLDIGRLVAELWRANPKAWLGVLATLIIGGARTGLYVSAMGGVVGGLAGQEVGGHSALFWLGIYILASAIEEFTWTVQPVAMAYLRDHGVFRIQSRLLERTTSAPLIQFEEGDFFEHLQRANRDMGERLVNVYGTLTSVGQMVFPVVSLALALYFVHPILLPLIVLGALPSLWLQMRVATVVYQTQREHTVRDRVRMHLQRLLMERDAAAEVRLFGSASYLLGRWSDLRTQRADDIVSAERRRAFAGAASGLFSGVAYAAGLMLVAYLILHGQLSIGNYATVATGALWFEGMLGGLVSSLRSLEEESQFLGDLFDFLRVARVEGNGVEGARIVSRGAMEIEANGITLSYPSSPNPVIRGVSLRIAPGERIALVGENGAGKTTLAKLLTGLYQPDRGTVRVNGVALTPGIAIEARKRIAAVFQDYATFHLTARESIGFGDLDHMHDEAALIAAAAKGDVARLIESLPEGLDGYLGREFGNMDVSGGQWQRIALARAFFRDADLLVLDEPTAALDPKAELDLFERFARLVTGKTTIMISHRLGMARLADRVIVLHEGEIVEEGHHDELMVRNGLYARMFRAQARWYQ